MADAKTTTVVAPYDRVSDVNVVISVLHPRPVVGLGNLLILNAVTAKAPVPAQPDGKGDKSSEGNAQTTPATTLPDQLSIQDHMNGILLRKTDKATGAIYREYKNINAVAVDYGEDTAVYKKAQTYFAQSNHSDRVAVLDYDPSKAYDALKAFWYFNWTFAVRTSNDVDDNLVALSNIFEANKNHILVVQSNDVTQFDKIYGQNYTVGLKHDTAENMDSALVGAVATLTVGPVTWKFKQLKGVTPEVLTSNELSAIHGAHAFAYVEVSGVGETSEGWTMSGEYIDVIHGIIWVNTNMENKLEKFLQENGKVSYDQVGITRINGVATQVMEQAYAQGIILTDETTGKGDYTVTTSQRSEQSQQDLSDRHYGGLSFTYHVSGAIHSITVHGEVQSDTILN